MASSSHAAIDRTSETGAGLGAPRFLIALVAILLLRQLWWAVFGKLNVDEFEEVQVLWLIDQGIWPWRDFLHTHLPFYNFLLYPIFAVGE